MARSPYYSYGSVTKITSTSTPALDFEKSLKNIMNIDIKKITKTIMRKNRGLQDPQLIYPARDWAIGMMGTLVIVCVAVGYSVLQYRSYTNLSLDEEVVLTMIPYRTALVEQALVRYRALSATHNEIISATSNVVIEAEDTVKENEDVVKDPEVDTDAPGGVPSLSN